MVFTGLVTAIGKAMFNPNTNQIFVKTSTQCFINCNASDSIAVNGCCLTVLDSTDDTVVFFIMEESRSKTNPSTIAKTNLNFHEISQLDFNTLAGYTFVNLEKALKFGDHLGGHIVLGHVHGVVPITQLTTREDGSTSVWVDLSGHDCHGNRVTTKGSIALDGVSLTVAEIKNNKARVSIIPYTLHHTIIQFWKEGDKVNVEFDQGQQVTRSANSQSGADFQKSIDEEVMHRAIKLGELGRLTSAPNPWVGCVITDPHGNIITEGYHRKAGEPHAEVNAINNAIGTGQADRLDGATCYATLEPCCHYGRTGPCDLLLIQHKIARVVIALIDPDEKVSGFGSKRLLDAGISVVTGVLEKEAAESLRAYLHHRKTGIPWVVLKLAATMNGKMTNPDPNQQWVSGKAARNDSHCRFRATSQAIIVGSGTAVEDNPSLTARSFPLGFDEQNFVQPLRVVIGSKPFALGSNLLNTGMAPTEIFTSSDALVPLEWYSNGVHVTRVKQVAGHVDFGSVLTELGRRGILQVLVEGGATFGSALLSQGHVNQLVIYHAPILHDKNSPGWGEVKMAANDERRSRIQNFWKLFNISVHENDVCTEYLNEKP